MKIGGSIEALFAKYQDFNVIKRAERYAGYTIPSLMIDGPQATIDVDQQVTYDYQSVGSLLVNNLAAKLVRLLFPAAQPFFRLPLTDKLEAAIRNEGVQEDAVRSSLVEVEKGATGELLGRANLSKLTRIIKMLIVAGQCLVYRDPTNGNIRVWNLQSHAVRRDPTGTWREIVLKQTFQFQDLEPDIKADLMARKPAGYNASDTIHLYIHVERPVGSSLVKVHYEADTVGLSRADTHAENLCPWVVPAWDVADGEHYGRGLVEEYTGDFAKLSLLSEESALYMLEMLKLLHLVDPAGQSAVDDIQSARTGDAVPGKAGAVNVYEGGDYRKVDSVEASINALASRLSTAFMYTGNTREAERVTAAEIRMKAQEAETSLGGAYSVLAENLQTPLAYLCIFSHNPQLFVGLTDGSFVPEVMTGIPALSRSIEVQNLLTASQELSIVVPVIQQLDNRVSIPNLLDLFYESYGVNTERLFKSAAELEEESARQEEQAAAQSQLVAEAADLQTAQAAIA